MVRQATGSIGLVHVTLYDFLLGMRGILRFRSLVTFDLLAKVLLLTISGRWLVLVRLGGSDGHFDSLISLLQFTAVRSSLPSASDSIANLHVAGLSVAPSRLWIVDSCLQCLAIL